MGCEREDVTIVGANSLCANWHGGIKGVSTTPLCSHPSRGPGFGVCTWEASRVLLAEHSGVSESPEGVWASLRG